MLKHPKTEIDERLGALADPDLAARLIAKHPDLYPDRVDDQLLCFEQADEQPDTRAGSSRRPGVADVFVALALIAALVTSILMPVVVGRERPTPVPRSPQAAKSTHQRVQTQVNHKKSAQVTPPAAIQRQPVQAQSRSAAHAYRTLRPMAIRSEHVMSAARHTVIRPIAHKRLALSAQPALKTSPALEPKLGQAASPNNENAQDAATSTDTATSAGTDDSTYPGRQIPSGAVWTESSTPGRMTPPGGVVLGGGVSGGSVWIPRGHDSCSPSRGGFIGSI